MTSRSTLFRAAGTAAVAAAVAIPLALPSTANAWWRGGWGFVAPPVVVGPAMVYARPVVYAPSPVVYAPPYPGAFWIAPRWFGGAPTRSH